MRAKSLFVAFLLLTAVACGSSASDGGGDPMATTEPAGVEVIDLDGHEFEDLTGQDEVVVQARDNTFVPAYIEVSPGTTVLFRNTGRNDHNVIPSNDGAFEPIEATDLAPKDEAELVFDEAGDFPYFCSLHGTRTKGMVGGVRVVAD